MKRLYIHVGTHKTGTTTIQHSLRNNDQILKEMYNLYYPDISIVSEFTHYAHHEISHAIANSSKKINDQQLESFFIELTKELEFQDVILSAEPIYRHYLSNIEGDIWDKKKAYYSKLASLLPKNCEVVLILYIRQPDKFAASMYSEKVLATNYSEDFTTFLQDFDYHFDYKKNIEVLKECISDNIIIKPFDKKQFKDNNLLSDFYNIFDIDYQELDEIEDKNNGLSRFFVEVKRVFNKCGYSRKNLNILRSYFDRLSSNEKVFYIPENGYFKEDIARQYNDERYYPYPTSYYVNADNIQYDPSITIFLHIIFLVKKNVKEFHSLDLIEVTQKYLEIFGNSYSTNINDILFITESISKCVSKDNKYDFYEYGKFLVQNGLEEISVIIFHELFYNRKIKNSINDLVLSYYKIKSYKSLSDIYMKYIKSELLSSDSKKLISNALN